MVLVKWQELPEFMQTSEVRTIYQRLERKKIELFMKRIFDFGMSIIMLLFLLFPMGVIAIWVKLDSKGPIIFRQTRITVGGRKFQIYKFRTMVTDASKIGTQVTVGQDPRITKAGRVLRKYRLDELPQLWNVMLGDMSFVGTRPEVPRYVASYTPEMMATLLMPAGITSEASIQYKDEDRLLEGADNPDKVYVEQILPKKMEYNLHYIREFRLITDISIMLRTITAVLK